MVTISMTGDTRVQNSMLHMAARTQDMRPAFSAVYKEMLAMFSDTFQSEGGRKGMARWAPLSPQYRKWKSIRYPGMGILTRSGMLRSSIASRGAGHRKILAPTFMIVGTSNRYAGYHQSGVVGRLPSRPFIRPSAEDIRIWTRLVMEFIRGRFGVR